MLPLLLILLCVVSRVLSIDPAARANHVPVLRRERLALIVLDALVQILV